MVWKKGQSGNPAGMSPDRKPITDAIRWIGLQTGGSKDRIRLPKKATNFQRTAASMYKAAFKQDIAAIREILDRIEGKVPQPVQGSPDDAPPVKLELSMSERARRIASILLSEQARQQEEAAKEQN